MLIGVLSDTHKVLFPKVLERLRGVEQIIHAGDIGSELVLADLRRVAPVSAVTGNHDWGTALDARYPHELSLELEGCRIYVTHIGWPLALFYQQLPDEKPHVVISGHSHRASIEHYQGVLFLNPGSASFPRGTLFSRDPLVPRIALLHVEQGLPSAEILHVKV